MKKLVVMLFAASMIMAVSDVFANNAGCGFGTFIMKGQKGKLFEILAVTTNGTSASSTFAITSGTSGYKEGSVIGVNIVETYVAQNMDNLATDIAKGDGEYLDTLAHLMKVENKDGFKNTLHTNFNRIYKSKDITSKQVVSEIKELIG